MITVIDSSNLSPKNFAIAINECMDFLPVKVTREFKICIKDRNNRSKALGYEEAVLLEDSLIITLFGKDIDDYYKHRNRLEQWLFVTLHEIAHIYFSEQSPKQYESEEECHQIARDTLKAYKKSSANRRI